MIVVMNKSKEEKEEALGTMIDEALEDSRRLLESINHLTVPPYEVYLNTLYHEASNINIVNLAEAQKIHSVSAPIIEASMGLAQRYASLVKKVMYQNISEDILWQITQEFEWLFLHCVDRVAYNCLDEEARLVLINALCRAVAKANTRYNRLPSNRIKTGKTTGEFLEQYDEATLTYSRYKKMITDNNRESTKETLIWQFSKKISKLIHGKTELYLLYFGILSIPGSIDNLCIEDSLKQWMGRECQLMN